MIKKCKGRLAIDLGEYYGHTAIVEYLRQLSEHDYWMEIKGRPELQRMARL